MSTVKKSKLVEQLEHARCQAKIWDERVRKWKDLVESTPNGTLQDYYRKRLYLACIPVDQWKGTVLRLDSELRESGWIPSIR